MHLTYLTHQAQPQDKTPCSTEKKTSFPNENSFL